MIVAAVYKNPEERRNLTDLLLALYPGGIVYEFSDPLDAMLCMRSHALDAVFLELSGKDLQNMQLLNRIRQENTSIPVFICAEDDTLLDEAMWNGASNYFVKPLQPEQIRSALLRYEKESVNLLWK